MTKRICLLLSGLMLSIAGQAQSFRLQASVNPVQQSGFQRILLPPDVVGHLNANLTDIRLYDSQRQETPYLLIREQPTSKVPFTDYELVSKQLRPNVSTTLVIRNQTKRPINVLELAIKNTNVRKKAQLSGSSDAKSWYGIDDDIWISPSQNSTTTTQMKHISFPLSDYTYYKLTINDSLSTPLNILRIGYYHPVVSSGAYTAISNLSFAQRDSSDRHSYIRLTPSKGTRFDKLTIFVKATTPFRRQASIGQFRTRKLKRGRIDHWFKVIRTFDLSLADSNEVDLPGIKANDLFIVIANDDNPPLVIRDVRAYQLTTYLLANLTAGQSYQLHFSADNMASPIYDLTPFKPITPVNQPVINIGTLQPIDSNHEQPGSFFSDSRIIWPALGLVLLLLGVMSYRMLREMGETPNL